jgi:hypothetical protein
MAIDYNTVADRVFDQLKGFGFSIVMFDKDGKDTVNATEGRTFYSKDQKFTVVIDEDEKVIQIKYGDNTDQQKLQKLVNSIENGIARKYLLGVDRMPYTGKEIEPKDAQNETVAEGKKVDKFVANVKKSEKKAGHSDKESEDIAWATANKKGMLDNKNKKKVAEGFGPVVGSSKTSYQQTEGAKLIIRHNTSVNEEIRGSRSRNIASLFIENAQGERFKYPYNHLAAARTMTQHVSRGGNPYDTIGQKIIGLSEERNQLLRVTSYIKGQGLQEQAGDVHFAVNHRIQEIKSLLGKYNPEKIMSDIHEEDETNIEALKERLTKNIFDENISNMLPKLNGYIKEYQTQLEAKQQLESLKQQVEESTSITVSQMPDLDSNSMMIYESPTVNTTELINLILPVLEDANIKESLAALSKHVQEGHLDPLVVENLTRSIINKSKVKEEKYQPSLTDYMFESVFKKYSTEEILK